MHYTCYTFRINIPFQHINYNENPFCNKQNGFFIKWFDITSFPAPLAFRLVSSLISVGTFSSQNRSTAARFHCLDR
jgi:hypothetical protein